MDISSTATPGFHSPSSSFMTRTGPAHRVLLEEIENIMFTGRDTAAGQSYEAWKRRKDEEKARQAVE